MRFPNLQTMIPWCFQLGWNNRNEEGEEEEETPTVHLIKSDGCVDTYTNPTPVSQVLKEFPNHMICTSDSIYVGRMIPPVSSEEYLSPGKVYFLLPEHMFRTTLSFISLASFRFEYSSTCYPFSVDRTTEGCLKLRVCEEFLKRIGNVGVNVKGRICTSDALDKEYRMLVVEHRRWKPVLGTITEGGRRRRSR